MKRTAISILYILLAVLSVSIAWADTLSSDKAWDTIAELIVVQEFKSAHTEVEKILQKSMTDNDAENWTRALIERTRLRIALRAPETAVRELKGAPWPQDDQWRTVLSFYYAHALQAYQDMYDWEIRQREPVAETDPAPSDFKLWSIDQISNEISEVYARVWRDRERWDEVSIETWLKVIERNTYPERIRGTLRDAVTYLWVEQLSDTGYWPAHLSNEVHNLDLPQLMAGAWPDTSDFDLYSSQTHPLQKVSYVLADLRDWHLKSGRSGAAFEADLQRLRCIRKAAPNESVRLQVRQYLETLLTDVSPSDPWWSVGQWQLAKFLLKERQPDSRIRAHLAATKGARRHPKNIGGVLCAQLLIEIEDSDFSLMSMSCDAAEKRSIQISHQNLEHLYFRAWKYSIAERLEQDLPPHPKNRDITNLVKKHEPTLRWTVDLPPVDDYNPHTSYTGLPACEPGAYIVAASTRWDFREGYKTMRGLGLIVGDLVVTTQSRPNEVEVLARSGETGVPLAGVDITAYQLAYRGADRDTFVCKTDSNGRAVIPYDKYHKMHLLAWQGMDVAWVDGSFYTDPVDVTGQDDTFIYTDRSIYRPGQTVHWKIVAYASNPQETLFETLKGRTFKVQMEDATRSEVVGTTVRTNDFGSTSGSFDIPATGCLGRWRIVNSLGGVTTFEVEAYKRPTYEVSFDDPKTPLALNENITLTGRAKYYFGGPVQDTDVRWRVVCSPEYSRFGFGNRYTQRASVSSGTTTLDQDGRFSLDFRTDQLAPRVGAVFRYTVSATVTNRGGETISAQRSFRLGAASVLATIKADFGFLQAEKAGVLTVLRQDLNRIPQPGHGRWSLYALEQPGKTQMPADEPKPLDSDLMPQICTPGDFQYPRWRPYSWQPSQITEWARGDLVDSGLIHHGEDGRGEVPLLGLASGAYRLVYDSKDDRGVKVEALYNFLVVDPKQAALNVPLVLLPEYKTVRFDDTARFVLQSGFEDQDAFVQIHEGGQRIFAQWRRLGHEAGFIEIPVTKAAWDGLSVSVNMVRDHQFISLDASVDVSRDWKRMNVEFITLDDQVTPGQETSVTVRVSHVDGTPVDPALTEVLAYMYDRSLDAVVGHKSPRPDLLYQFSRRVAGPRSCLGLDRFSWRSRNIKDRTRGPWSFRPDRLSLQPGRGWVVRKPDNKADLWPDLLARLEADGVHVLPPFEVEGEEYMVEVTSSATRHSIGSNSFEKYAIDSAYEAIDLTHVLRENFAETAVFLPHLKIDAQGEATFRIKVPDSVTDWNLYVHAMTEDVSSGSAMKQISAVKDLMVRPYLPRFLREGDSADLKIVVNNVGDTDLEGVLHMSIEDVDTGRDLSRAFGLSSEPIPFEVEAKGSRDRAYKVTAPVGVRSVRVRVVAQTNQASDGEQRVLPVLPGRMHLMQSRFATLDDQMRRELAFPVMASNTDATRIQEQLVVTIDAQLFGSVLGALPYLVDYPYECAEQTLNRFLSTSIIANVFSDHPQVRAMATKMSQRKARTEAWNKDDVNRKILLEETPWLKVGGGVTPSGRLINILNPETVKQYQQSALSRLEELQVDGAGLSWFPGGEASPYMTLLVLHGLARGMEFGVEPPRYLSLSAWSYLSDLFAEHFKPGLVDGTANVRLVTFLNYILSCYPEDVWRAAKFTADDQHRMLDYSLAHRKDHSRLLKGYLAMTLHRAGRTEDARRIYDSVLDNAKTDPDLGTYWSPEDRSWLWFNDHIESHAYALRVMTELYPGDERSKGLVKWLLLNKKLGHWKSTRATAEVIYALVCYMQQAGTLAVREAIDVKIGGQDHHLVFEPDEYTGRNNQIIVEGDDIDPQKMATVVVEKQTPGMAFASATWHYSTEMMPEAESGDLLGVTRAYYRRIHDGQKWILEPLGPDDTVTIGDQVEVQLSLTAKHAVEYVHLRDPRGAGFEPERATSGYRWQTGVGYYEEIRDSGANYFFTKLPAGQYTFKYRLRANMAGEFKVGPAQLQSMYAPEFTGYSAGRTVKVVR